LGPEKPFFARLGEKKKSKTSQKKTRNSKSAKNQKGGGETRRKMGWTREFGEFLKGEEKTLISNWIRKRPKGKEIKLQQKKQRGNKDLWVPHGKDKTKFTLKRQNKTCC